MLYGLHCGHVDIKTVRLAIASIIEMRDLTQTAVEEASGIGQSHISKIIRVGDDPTEMNDLAARVVFDIVEKGLGMPLSTFFEQLERQTNTGTENLGNSGAQPRIKDVRANHDPHSPPLAPIVSEKNAAPTVIHDLAATVDQQNSKIDRLSAIVARLQTEVEAYRRQAASARAQAAEQPPSSGTRSKRTPKPPPLGRQRRRRPKR